MAPARERMRPWLVRQIDSGAVPGLRWLDQERTLVSIPWKHAAGHGWRADQDASLFQRWAEHTGKHVEGQPFHHKTWKANFRCALHSLPDVTEVKDRSVHKGQAAARVYKLLPEKPRSRDRRSKSHKTKAKQKIKFTKPDSNDEPSDSPREPPSVDRDPAQDNTVDNTVDSTMDSTVDSTMDSTVDSTMDSTMDSSGDSGQRDLSDVSFDGGTRMIFLPLERNSNWRSLNENDKNTTSRGSLWSETSSGEETEESPLPRPLIPSHLFLTETWSPSLPQALFEPL